MENGIIEKQRKQYSTTLPPTKKQIAYLFKLYKGFGIPERYREVPADRESARRLTEMTFKIAKKAKSTEYSRDFLMQQFEWADNWFEEQCKAGYDRKLFMRPLSGLVA